MYITNKKGEDYAMKKILMIVSAIFVLMASAVCASASTTPKDYMPENDKYNIVHNVGIENAYGMYGMIAIKGNNTAINTVDDSAIYYINQVVADSEGNISFINVAPKGVAPSDAAFEECTVFIGGPGLDTAETIGYLRKGSTVTFLLGDIDGNGSVDIDDAILLLQYSIFPDFYPIEYTGNVDFDKSGEIDIDDAILLLQYSIYPDFYPIG